MNDTGSVCFLRHCGHNALAHAIGNSEDITVIEFSENKGPRAQIVRFVLEMVMGVKALDDDDLYEEYKRAEELLGTEIKPFDEFQASVENDLTHEGIVLTGAGSKADNPFPEDFVNLISEGRINEAVNWFLGAGEAVKIKRYKNGELISEGDDSEFMAPFIRGEIEASEIKGALQHQRKSHGLASQAVIPEKKPSL